MRSSWLYLRGHKTISVSQLGVDVLGQAFSSARRACLDLARAEADDQVCDEGVFRLAAAMTHHCAPAGGEGKQGGFDALGYRAYLVHFEEQRVAGFGFNAGLDALGIGHEQVVANLQPSA